MSITAIFASDVLVRLMQCFLLNPEREYYQSELQQLSGSTLSNTQKMLHKLEEAGLITQFKRGKMVYYHANREHPAFEDLKRLLLKTVAIGDVIKSALQSIDKEIELAFIYGSYAKGEEAAHSDIDLFILGDVSLRRASEILGPVMETIGRELNPTIYLRKELQQKYKDKNHFVMELLSCPKVWLIGSDNDIKAMVKRG